MPRIELPRVELARVELPLVDDGLRFVEARGVELLWDSCVYPEEPLLDGVLFLEDRGVELLWDSCVYPATRSAKALP